MQRKREKRQKVAAREIGLSYTDFHKLHLPPTIALVNYKHPIQHLDNTESSLLAGIYNSQDIGNFLPPPSPLLQPNTEGVFFDEPPRAVSILFRVVRRKWIVWTAHSSYSQIIPIGSSRT